MDKCTLLAGVAIVGWILTAIGWFVQNFFANDRETRKEVREELSKMDNEVRDLLKSSHSYYCCAKKAEQTIAQSEIYSSFNRLSGIVQRLESFDSGIKIQKKLDDLYEAITGGDFGSSKFKCDCEVYVEKGQRFALLAEALVAAGEDWYRTSYQK